MNDASPLDDRDFLLRRPLVVVEDQIHHVSELLELVQREAPSVLASLVVVCVDRPGPDTRSAAAQWTERHATVRVAVVDPGEVSSAIVALSPEVLTSVGAWARAVAALLRSGGVLLQDVHLETLEFVPADRWWESIYLASTIRGSFAERPPRCLFLSNKRGYQATFGQELIEAGFDPRDVFRKDELASFAASLLQRELDTAFPLRLRGAACGGGVDDRRVAAADGATLDRLYEVVLHLGSEDRPELGGTAVPGARVRLDPTGEEVASWRALVEEALVDGPGLPVLSVGERLAPRGALRPELTNAASRHVYALRRRLSDGQGIRNVDSHYRLAEDWRAAIVRR